MARPTKEEKAEQSDARAAAAPMFADAEGNFTEVRVWREQPVEEKGFLGNLPASTTEEELGNEFGGGTYRMQLVAGHKIAATRTISIAGDPRFQSAVARAKWQRRNDVSDPQPVVAAAAAPPPDTTGPMLSMMVTMFAQLQKMQADADERRARMQIEAEERRRREDLEREERRKRDEAEQRERDRQHQQENLKIMQTLIQAQQGPPAAEPGGNAVELLLKGVELARSLAPAAGGGGGGEGDDDDGGGEDVIASGVKSAVRGIIDAIGSRGQSGPPAPAPPSAREAGNGSLQIDGILADHIRGFVVQAQAQGMDPEAALTVAVQRSTEKLHRRALSAAPPSSPSPTGGGGTAESPAPAPTDPPHATANEPSDADPLAAAAARLAPKNGITLPSA